MAYVSIKLPDKMGKRLIILLLLAFLFRAVLAFVNWHPDLNNHVDWGIRFWQYGPGEFYNQNVWSFSWPNQPPLTILIFAFIRKLFEFIFNAFWWINVNVPFFPSNIMLFFEYNLYQALLKLPSILADLGIAYLIFTFLKEKRSEKAGFWGASLFLVNPAVWYNSSIWGQTDATINFFGLLAILLLIKKKIVLSFLFVFTSLLIKASLVVLLPIFLIVALKQRYTLGTWIKALGCGFLIVGFITLPFSQSEPFSWLFNLYKDKVFGWQLHLITANAFNLWAALTGIHEQKDTLMAGPFNFRTWGYLLFGEALIPLLVRVYKKFNYLTVLWVSFLTVFGVFVLSTGMHERYLYPIFPFLTLIVALDRKWLPALIGLSVIYLLNLYNFWWYPRIEWLVDLLSAWDRLMPRLVGAVITIIFIWVYFRFFTQKQVK